MYSVTNAGPGTSTVKCIKVTYTGSMPADVKLYTPSTLGAGANYIDLTIEKGTGNPTFPGCTGFTSGSTIYTGTLGGVREREELVRERRLRRTPAARPSGTRTTRSSTASR